MPSYEDMGSVNSEIRYITIELMKLSSQRKVTFKKVANEFLKNTMDLHEMIQLIEKSDDK